MYLNIGIPNNHHFPFGTNGKVVVLGVPILKHFRVNAREKQDHSHGCLYEQFLGEEDLVWKNNRLVMSENTEVYVSTCCLKQCEVF